MDNFLREFVSSVNCTDVGPEVNFITIYSKLHKFHFQVVSDSMLAELKECFMEAYDDNKDGKIEIREVCIFCLSLFFILLFSFLSNLLSYMKNRIKRMRNSNRKHHN